MGAAHEKPGAGAEALDFEAAVERVETIIERLESGAVGLEESIAQYEQGVELLRRCRAMLERAEQRVTELMENRIGTEPRTEASGSRKRSKGSGRAADKGLSAESSDEDGPAPF
jgi:exodeoxyribonuclease VII small subunit